MYRYPQWKSYLCVYPSKLNTYLFRRTVKISLEASKWQVATIYACSQYTLGQAKMEQPSIKKLQQLIFNAYSTNMYPISMFHIQLSMVNAEYNTKHKYRFYCGYLYRYPQRNFDLY